MELNPLKSVKAERGELGLQRPNYVCSQVCFVPYPIHGLETKSGCSAQVKVCLTIFTQSWKHLVNNSGYQNRTGRLYKHIFICDKVIFTSGLDCGFPFWAILVNYTPVLNVKLVFLKFNFEMLGLFSLCI